ncbi:MAG: hypothetical protein AAFY15_14635 [Cyanobacteria bacterium J06648_11]
MTADDFGEGLLDGWNVQMADDFDGDGGVVRGAARLEFVEEPEALLVERQRHERGARMLRLDLTLANGFRRRTRLQSLHQELTFLGRLVVMSGVVVHGVIWGVERGWGRE